MTVTDLAALLPAHWTTGADVAPPFEHLGHVLGAAVRTSPGAPALVVRCDGGTTVRRTYAELDADVRRRARALRRAGVDAGDAVVVVAARTPGLVPTVLALLSVGATYVPVDPAAPPARWRVVARAAGARALAGPAGACAVAREHLADLLGDDAVVVDVDADVVAGPDDAGLPLLPDVDPATPAYVLFTSGSTGEPKGVVVTHANVVHRLPAYLGLTDGPCRYLLHSSLAFDGAVGGLFSTLARGGCLVLVPDAVAGDPALAALAVREEGVTHLEPVPSWYAALLELAAPGDLASVRAVVLGGEVVPPALVSTSRRLLPRAVLVDDYGPTEVTVAATAFVVPPTWDDGALPIGRPHPATAVAVLDDAGAPVADGEVGELWVAGPCVAAGYLGRPDDPAFGVVPGTTVPRYRTGDLVRWRADGQLAFCGRRDRQVKVRGQRVEPEEVEAVLGGLPGVAAAAVEVVGSGEATRLVAYAAPRAGAVLTVDGVVAALAERLPTHLRPGAVVVLDVMPLTPGGKVDRRALPAPPRADDAGEAPRDDLERAVADAMEAVLGLPVHRGTDFHRAGGQSLGAARVAARLRESTGVAVVPGDLAGAGTPAALAERLRGRPSRPAAGRPGTTGATRGPASARQESFWFLEHAPGGAGRSNLVEVLVPPPGTPPAVLHAAAQVLVDRHPALRTRFELTAEGLLQVVEPQVRLAVEALGPVDDDDELLALADRWGAAPFDLGAAPLLRAAVVPVPAGPALVLVVHHAVADGWSLGLLVEEVDALVRSGGDASALPAPSALTPVDVAAPEADRTAAERDAAAAALAEVLRRGAVTGERLLPFDGPGGTVVLEPGVARAHLPADVVGGARELAAALGTTTFTVLSASLGALLARTSDQPEVLLGVPTSGRGAPETDRLVGCLIGTGLVPVDVAGDPTFADVVRRTAASAAAVAEHAWLPLEVPLRGLAEGERAAAVPVLLNLLETPTGAGGDRRAVERRSRPGAMAYAELDLYLTERDGGVAVEAVHRLDRLGTDAVGRLLARWERLLRRAVAAPTTAVADLPVTTPEEDAALDALEREPAPRAPGLLLEQVRARLAEDPGAVALRDGGPPWTRAALWSRAGEVAALLVRRGAGPGDRVVVALDGDADAVAALVGCWRAGAVPVPVGEEQPPARLRRLVESCGARVVLDRDLLARLDDDPGAEDDGAAVPDRTASAQEPAYVLLTSGTTGEPKGVVVGHGALAASTLARLDAYPDRPRTALVAHDMAFDAALGIIAWYLWTGGELVLVERAERLDPARLADLVRRHGVGQLDVVPSHHRLLLDLADPGDLRSLELVTLGGEPCTPSLVRAHRAALPGTALVNEYGPTESTVWSLAHTCRDEDGRPGGRVPVGRPVLGVTARVADAQGRRRPPGTEGELLLGGHLLADGYLGDEARTAERFVVHDGRRWYRTGDRVRSRADGALEFLGRDDAQVKVRGFRVELEEVDSALTALPGVTRGVAGVLELVEHEPVLVGWVQPAAAGAEGSPAPLDVEHLRDVLLTHLPEWAVPGVLVVVDELPETTAGKVDRSRLPRPAPVAGGAPPQTPSEHLVVGVWEELLGREVGVDRTFAALGGQSLLAARMVVRLRAETGLDVDLRDVLAAPRARDVASLLDRLGTAGKGPAPASPDDGAATAHLGDEDVDALLTRLDELDDDEVARLLAQVEGR